MKVRSLGYLRLASPDVAAWRTFAGDFLGMMSADREGSDAARFRMDGFPARLVIEPAAEAATLAIGFEVLDRNELAGLAEAVESAGIDVVTGSSEECAERGVTGMVRFIDPGGNPIELFYGPILAHDRVVTPQVSGFVTDDLGMGHVIASAEDLDAQYAFYTRVLGFVERNTMAGGRVVFLGCNPRHHTFGINRTRGPGTLMHLMVEVETLDDVGRGLDRAEALGIPMMHSLGKHTNDHMVSFYVWSPEGLAVELGWNGLRVEGEVPTYEITEGAFWGHRFTPPPTR